MSDRQLLLVKCWYLCASSYTGSRPHQSWDSPFPSMQNLQWRVLNSSFSKKNMVSNVKTICLLRSWNPREPAGMLRVVQAWQAAAPGWLLRAAATRALLPRLLAAVRAWDPTGDTQPLHQWVHTHMRSYTCAHTPTHAYIHKHTHAKSFIYLFLF